MGNKPTPEQMEHFYRLQEKGVVTRPNFQAFLENPGRFLAGFPISYDQSLGLMVLIQQAVGERNFGNISRDITPERFPLKGIGVRTVKARVEPYLDEETSEQAAVRLIAAGYNLGNTGDLAAFLHDYPGEVEKWVWVLAISEDSRWAGPGGRVCVPYAFVRGAGCGFYPHALRNQLNSRCGALVLSE